MLTNWHLIHFPISIHLNSVSYLICSFEILPFYKHFNSHYNQLSLFSVSLESTLPSCATLGILLYLILSHSRDTQTHINFPNPCWIKSAHRSAFVLTCPPFYSDSFILCSFNISSFYKHFHRKNTSQSTMSTFSLYHFQVFSIMCHFRHFPIFISFPQQGYSDPY